MGDTVATPASHGAGAALCAQAGLQLSKATHWRGQAALGQRQPAICAYAVTTATEDASRDVALNS